MTITQVQGYFHDLVPECMQQFRVRLSFLALPASEDLFTKELLANRDLPLRCQEDMLYLVKPTGDGDEDYEIEQWVLLIRDEDYVCSLMI